MKHIHALIIATALLATGCRELVSPGDGYLIVENILSPVSIRTKDLEGSGWVKAFLPTKAWELIFLNPSGTFVYNDVLPPKVWHCDPQNGSQGCVAKLQVGDEKGFLSTGRTGGALYVCTENYVQKVGRKHCGKRAFEGFSFFGLPVDPDDRVDLYANKTQGVVPGSYPNGFPHATGLYSWHGDSMSRLITGSAEFPNASDYQPPAEGDPTAVWHEYPFSEASPLVAASNYNMSIDIGACSLFLPHEWKNRINDAFTPLIGDFTAPKDAQGNSIPNPDGSVGRGFAELLIDGILESPPAPDTRLEENVIRWIDAASTIIQRTDVSPEIHFRMSNVFTPNPNNDTIPQFCLKNYMTANNDLLSGVEDWYRWDQGFLSGLTSLFNIGSCRRHPFSMMYCGAIGIRNGKGVFNVAPDVAVGMEGYSVFKPSCNNSFIPKLKTGVKNGARTAGAQNMADGIDKLVQALQDKVEDLLGVDEFLVRDLVLTPSGVYIETAYDVTDPQYALHIGNCVGDLETPPVVPTTQPRITVEYTARGITRPVP